MKGRNRLAVLITGALAATLSVSASTASREPSIVQPLPQSDFHPIHLVEHETSDVVPPPPPTSRPRVSVPVARPRVLSLPNPSTSSRLTGQATWYAWHLGQAAAGPVLRAALGPSWRGRIVRVCVGARCISVRLTDWCACRPSTRLIDLDVRTFATLGPTWRGILPVEVRW